MASYISSWTPVLQSINPFTSSPTTSPLPAINSPAPSALGSLNLPSGTGHPVLVAFVRHCGCPFAEKEVKLLGAETSKHSDLHVVIVQHSEEKETQEWFERIGGPKAFPSSDRYTLLADPARDLYAKWGIGVLGWSGMMNTGTFDALKKLKASDGIDLTPTGKGSWRWQNSGGFAVDGQGKVRWRKIATDSADMCDYAEAAGTVVGGQSKL